jgi:choline dehydrogenase-like flavoprotein
MTLGPFEVGAFTRSDPSQDRPDIQLYFSAYTRAAGRVTTEREPGFTVATHIVRTESLGSVHISSADPAAAPTITPNYLHDEADRRRAVATVHFLRTLIRQPAFAKYVGEELAPGARVESDEDITDAVLRRLAGGTHALGTCAMGRDDTAVVDSHLRVRGVQGLRVIDCSAMPGLVSGNTSGPAMALAWRACDLIDAERRR